jgi:signal transduction protein with GAF and PtsI domain
MRLLLRLISLAFLVLGVIAGTIDAVQSVAASRVTLTPLADAWRDLSPATLDALTSTLSTLPMSETLSVAAGWLLGQPASIVLLVLSLLVYVIAYKRRKTQPRFYRA